MQDTQTPVPLPPSAQRPRRKSNWWIPLVVIGGLLLIIVVGVGLFVGVIASSMADVGGSLEEKSTKIKKQTVLVVDLSQGVVEYRPPVVLNIGGDEAGLHLYQVVTAIEDAKDDDNISGILIKSAGSTGMTKLTEIRDALIDFKTSDKFIYSFMNNGSKSDYYLATAADSIFMQAEGLLEFNAFGATGVFMKGLMNKIGVDWYVEQFEEYKSAAEQMSREGWSEPAKEAIREIILQRQKYFVDAVVQGRGMAEKTVTDALSRGVYIPDSLLALGLIDGLTREDDLRENLARRVNPSDTAAHPKLRTAGIKAYSHRSNKPKAEVDESKGLAIVFASGAIQSGKNDDPFDQSGIYSKTLIRDLRRAWKNDKVDGILLRIDSPGGSALASDEIWAAIQEIRKDKPVYASMSDVAASGGYYIAMACDTIIAAPSTITGSIGVIMAIPNLAGTMKNIGVTTDTISMGPSSSFMNTLKPFTAADKTQLHNFGEGVYKRFVQKVADSRGMTYEEARVLARGRVWTGTAAKENGLIDMTGDYHAALDAIKTRIGVEKGKKVYVHIYPEKVDNITAILKMFGIDRGSDDEDDDGDSFTKLSISDLLAASQTAGLPLSQIWDRLPQDARLQFEHSLRMTEIAAEQPVMTMMPFSMPSF